MQEEPTPNTELSAKPSSLRLSALETKAVTELFKDLLAMNKADYTQHKKDLFDSIKEDLPGITDSKLNSLWRNAEHEYYHALTRVPAEALINKINETSENLISRVLNESRKDIADQAKVVNEFHKTLAAVNKLTDQPAKIEINFKQELPPNYLLDPAIVIDSTTTKEKDNGENEETDK